MLECSPIFNKKLRRFFKPYAPLSITLKTVKKSQNMMWKVFERGEGWFKYLWQWSIFVKISSLPWQHLVMIYYYEMVSCFQWLYSVCCSTLKLTSLCSRLVLFHSLQEERGARNISGPGFDTKETTSCFHGPSETNFTSNFQSKYIFIQPLI